MARNDYSTNEQAQHFHSITGLYSWGTWMHTNLLTAQYACGWEVREDPEVAAWLDETWDRYVDPLINPSDTLDTPALQMGE